MKKASSFVKAALVAACLIGGTLAFGGDAQASSIRISVGDGWHHDHHRGHGRGHGRHYARHHRPYAMAYRTVHRPVNFVSYRNCDRPHYGVRTPFGWQHR